MEEVYYYHASNRTIYRADGKWIAGNLSEARAFELADYEGIKLIIGQCPAIKGGLDRLREAT